MKYQDHRVSGSDGEDVSTGDGVWTFLLQSKLDFIYHLKTSG
jgi:hypothetical protein